jgi:3-deoxy-D-manno-octulosonic acid kinase
LIRERNRTIVARTAELPALASLLIEHETLFGAAQRRRQGELAGRGIAIITELNGDVCVVRHFRRGGSVASLLDDRYLRAASNRVLRELQTSEAARARGVATPSVKCGAWYQHGLFRRFDIATLYIPDSHDLSTVIFDPGRSRRAAELTAVLIGSMLQAGLLHRDLNLKNILVAPDRAYVLDLDRCRMVEPINAAHADAMKARFFRSLAKFAAQGGRPAPADVVALLGEAFRV